MNIVNCYNKNNDYYIDFRQLLEEDEFAYYDEKLKDKDITFTDMAKEPSSVNEIISRTVHNYVINPDDLKYLILDKTVILDATSDNLIRFIHRRSSLPAVLFYVNLLPEVSCQSHFDTADPARCDIFQIRSGRDAP